MIDADYGTINIKLAELIEKKGISRNKVSHRAEIQSTQLRAYCTNSVTRVDLSVLARLCTVLDCSVEDILEFVPARNNE